MSRADDYNRWKRQREVVPPERAAALMRSGKPVTLELSPQNAFAVVASLQLALRHPQNVGPTANIARHVCHAIIGQLPEEIQTVARMGFDPEHDTHA